MTHCMINTQRIYVTINVPFLHSYEMINNDQNMASRIGVEGKKKKVTRSSGSFEWAPIRRENSEGR